MIPLSLQTRPTPIEVVLLVIAFGLLVTVFVRVGLVALASYALFDIALSRFPMALADDWRSEFAAMTLVVSLAVLVARHLDLDRSAPIRHSRALTCSVTGRDPPGTVPTSLGTVPRYD